MWRVKTEKQVHHLDTLGRLVPVTNRRLVVDPQIQK
jgi:hypothetical protein